MPTYVVTAPDGREYEVDAPDGATQEQVLSYAQQNYQQPQDDIPTLPAVQAELPDPSEGGGSLQIAGFDTGIPLSQGTTRGLAGFGKALVDTGRGLKQAGTDAARYFVEEGLGMEAPGLRASLASQQADIDAARERDAPLMQTGAGLGGNVAGYATTLLGPGAGLRGTQAARALLPQTIAGNAAQGAALGALQPVESGDSRAGNAGLGGLFGAGGATVAKAVGALGTRAAEAVPEHVRAIYEAAKARGIELTPAQLSDSRFMRWAQSMLRSVPFTGSQARYANQVGDFTRAVSKEIGEDTDRITPEVYAAAKGRIGGEFNRLTARNDLVVDTGLAGKLAAIQREASQYGGQETQQAVGSALKRLFDQAQGSAIPGRVYQSIDSQLGNLTKQGGEKAHYLGQIRTALREGMDASVSPGDQAAWQAARGQYRDLKTIRDLVAKSEDGRISPAALSGRITANNAGKESQAAGRRGGLGELARIGQRMKEPPSSGTAERGLVSGLLGGATYIDPVSGGLTAVGLNLLSRGMDSAALAKFVMRQNPGMTQQEAARIVLRMTNAAGQSAQSRASSPVQ